MISVKSDSFVDADAEGAEDDDAAEAADNQPTRCSRRKTLPAKLKQPKQQQERGRQKRKQKQRKQRKRRKRRQLAPKSRSSEAEQQQPQPEQTLQDCDQEPDRRQRMRAASKPRDNAGRLDEDSDVQMVSKGWKCCLCSCLV